MNSNVSHTMVCTAASPVHTHIPLSYKPLVCADLENSLDHLFSIICRFDPEHNKQWTDPVSRRLFEWGIEVISFDCSQLSPRSPVPSAVLIKASNCIDRLKKEILHNPMSPGEVLEFPVLERQWIWEKWLLNKTIETQKGQPHGSLSPYDQQPMQPMRAHEFAQEILAWTSSLSLDLSSREPSASASAEVVPLQGRAVVLSSGPKCSLFDRKAWESPSDPTLKFAMICYLAQEAIISKERRLIPDAFNRASDYLRKLSIESRQRMMQLEAQAREAAEAHERMLQLQIDNQQQAFQATAQGWEETRGVMLAQQEESVAQAAAVRAETAHDIALMEHAQGLAHQIAEATRQVIREERIAVEEEIVVREQVLNLRIDSIVNTNTRVVQVMQSRIEDGLNRNQTLSGQINAYQQTCASYANEVSQLRGTIAQQASQVQGLQGQSKSDCVIQ